jgi:hypothetical protein
LFSQFKYFRRIAKFALIDSQIISSVPLFAAMFRRAGALDDNKILGITTLGVIRASTFIAEEKVSYFVFSWHITFYQSVIIITITNANILDHLEIKPS